MNVSMFTMFTFVLFFKLEGVNLKKAGEEVEGNFNYEKNFKKSLLERTKKYISWHLKKRNSTYLRVSF